MLSEHELRRLNEIERELEITDPGLAASLSTMSRKRRWILPLALLGWATFAIVATMGWWLAALVVLAPLIPITFSAVAERLGGKGPYGNGNGDCGGGGDDGDTGFGDTGEAHRRPLDPLG